MGMTHDFQHLDAAHLGRADIGWRKREEADRDRQADTAEQEVPAPRNGHVISVPQNKGNLKGVLNMHIFTEQVPEPIQRRLDCLSLLRPGPGHNVESTGHNDGHNAVAELEQQNVVPLVM